MTPTILSIISWEIFWYIPNFLGDAVVLLQILLLRTSGVATHTFKLSSHEYSHALLAEAFFKSCWFHYNYFNGTFVIVSVTCWSMIILWLVVSSKLLCSSLLAWLCWNARASYFCHDALRAIFFATLKIILGTLSTFFQWFVNYLLISKLSYCKATMRCVPHFEDISKREWTTSDYCNNAMM